MTSLFRKKGREGFTLLEVLMVVALASVMAIVSIDLISDTVNEQRFEQTRALLQQIQYAMIGNPNLQENGVRTSFGYLGDVGALPTSIGALTTQPTPSPTAYAMNTTAHIGVGWNGPYLSNTGSGVVYTTDPWGNTILYSPSASPPTLISLGAGGTGSFSSPITVSLPTEMTTSTVSGYVCNRGGPNSSNMTVVLYYPNGNGVITSPSVTVSSNVFTFSNVPMGPRAISVYPSGSPSPTIGPVVITVDKPNFNVPCSKLDINP